MLAAGWRQLGLHLLERGTPPATSPGRGLSLCRALAALHVEPHDDVSAPREQHHAPGHIRTAHHHTLTVHPPRLAVRREARDQASRDRSAQRLSDLRL
jgi:hypothetical protein